MPSTTVPGGPPEGGGIPYGAIKDAGNLLVPWDKAAENPFLHGTVDPAKGTTRATAKVIHADIPLVTIQNTWTVAEARSAMYSHLIGIFYTSGMLCESILGDDRVTACLNAKATALFGKEVRFTPANGTAKAAKVCQAWQDWWPKLAANEGFRFMQDYSCLMGFAHSQVIWRTDVKGLPFGGPLMRPWFPQFEYYDWNIRRYMAMCMGQPVVPIVPGGGKWVEHAPFGSYRGWIRGTIRPVCEPWMLRHFGFRDMARFGEVHGNPTRKGKVPAVSDPQERALFEQQLAKLGADAAMIVPQGVDGESGSGYDYELVEARSSAWEVHPAQIDRCDMAIVLAILMVNLTTEVHGGSYAAADVHMDKEHGGTEFDNQAWCSTIYRDLARPFALLNFGDPDLAPYTEWDVTTDAARERNAKQFSAVATAFNQIAQGGVRFKDAEKVRVWMGRTFGLGDVPEFTLTDPKVAGDGLFGGGDKPKPPGGKGDE